MEDMWSRVDTMIQQRSANATQLQWIKGHVTLQQLAQGFSARDAVFNSYADAAADAAHTASNLRLRHEILGFFGIKQQDLVRILVAVLKRIARVAKAANDKLEALTKEQAIADIEVPIFSYFDRSSSAVGLSFINAVPLVVADSQALPAILVRIFWNSICVEPVVDRGIQSGTTWI